MSLSVESWLGSYPCCPASYRRVVYFLRSSHGHQRVIVLNCGGCLYGLSTRLVAKEVSPFLFPVPPNSNEAAIVHIVVKSHASRNEV